MGSPFALGSSLLAGQDVREYWFRMVHPAALCELKAASAAFCTHARRELCTRLCGLEGASTTDLDVECLNDAGRSWEVLNAGHQLPRLARLRGFGFVVDVWAVRNADLGADQSSDDESADEPIDASSVDEWKDDAPLRGRVLRSCFQGDGDPPRELLLAAVACAASRMVHRIPVPALRRDNAAGVLDLRPHPGMGVYVVQLLGFMLPAATSLRSLRCPSGNVRGCGLRLGESTPIPPYAAV